MIDERTRDYVRSAVENTPRRTGDMGSVISRGRRRHRVTRIATAVSVTAILLIAVGAAVWLRPADQPFVSGVEPSQLELPNGFVVDVAPESIVSEGAVVYVGMPGPEPKFDPAGLGTEIKLTPGVASDLVVPPSSNPLERNAIHAATLVYLGELNGTQVALQAIRGGFFGVGGTDYLCVFLGNGTEMTGGGTCDIDNGLAWQLDQDDPPIGDWVLWTGLPESAAVVTVESVDGTTYWQRPTARTVFFNLPDGAGVRPFTLVALDATGNTIPIAAAEGAPDLTLVVSPGPGPGAEADALAGLVGPPDIVEGTAEILGSVLADGIRFEIITFQSVGQDPDRAPDEESTCVAVVAGESRFSHAVCQPGADLPAPGSIGGWGSDDDFYWITEMTPDVFERAIVTTTLGRTIEIQQAQKVVFAVWPVSWGPPQSLAFTDQAGKNLRTIEY